VAHIDVPRGTQLTANRINRALPEDIRVTNVTDVNHDFDARFSAIWRRYSYRVSDGITEPLDRRFTLEWHAPLDEERMNAASELLVGEHDFAGFCKQRAGSTTVRELLELSWVRIGKILVMHVRADAFCHSMVRSLVGALLPIGDGRKPIDWAARGLVAKERQAGVTVMPPHPLVLEAVGYPPAEEWALRQQYTRTFRSTD
jgi:tRNA pseudouridine38-40 synthase